MKNRQNSRETTKKTTAHLYPFGIKLDQIMAHLRHTMVAVSALNRLAVGPVVIRFGFTIGGLKNHANKN